MIGCVCAIVCCCFWGFSFLFTKHATASVSAVTLLAWRFTIAFLAMSVCVVAGMMKINLKGKRIGLLLTIAILQPVVYYTGETLGIQYTTASESGVMIACIPIVTLLLSALILKKRPAGVQVMGICITMFGVIVCVLSKGMEAAFNPWGYAMLVVAVVSYGMYSVLAEKANEFTSGEKTYIMLAMGAVAFDIAAIIQNVRAGTMMDCLMLPFHDMDFLMAIVYLSIGCSVVAFFLFNVAIDLLGTNRASSFSGMSTLMSIIAGIIVLHEPFTPVQMIGTVCVIGGVYLANSTLGEKLVFFKRVKQTHKL